MSNETALWPGSTLPMTLPDPSEFDGTSAIAVAGVTIAVSTLFVGLRFWSRAVILRRVALEDWLILSALVCLSRRGGPFTPFWRN